jgi:ubiquinone/menaquinone biosynthesis C-methylase UbiE|tara:strand:+ start:795 stop:1427 length:633 start_codon:yes stop_codon:yes gene_type:complete
MGTLKKFYDESVLPHLLNCACNNRATNLQRSIIVPKASGIVLEIGFGSGLNLPYYDKDKVRHLWVLEPSKKLLQLAKRNINNTGLSMSILNCLAEDIPLPDNSVDDVLITYTMCTIVEPIKANKEIRRVLKKNGSLLFCEHGIAINDKDAKLQKRINPYWEKIAGGCQLTRDIPTIISQSGFKIDQLDQGYIIGIPKFAGYTYLGSAKHH